MAQQTKSKTTRSSSGSRSRKRGSASSSNGRSTAARSGSNAKSRSASAKSRSNAKSRSSTARRGAATGKRPTSTDKSPVTAVKDTAVEGAKSAGDTVATTAKKLRTPAIAAGVGLAGLAGGIALANRDRHRRVLGVALPTKSGAQQTSRNLAAAAKQAGRVAERTGELAAEVRRMRESIDENGKGSAVEAVLQRLVARS